MVEGRRGIDEGGVDGITGNGGDEVVAVDCRGVDLGGAVTGEVGDPECANEQSDVCGDGFDFNAVLLSRREGEKRKQSNSAMSGCRQAESLGMGIS